MELYKKAGEVVSVVIYNSATVAVGDRIKIANDGSGAGGADAADAVTDRELGICEGITTPEGIPLDQALSTEYDGTVTGSGTSLVYAAASDNESDKLIQAQVRCLYPIYRVTADATLGTTPGSNIPGYYIDVLTTDSTYVDEDTASASVANYLILKVAPSKTGVGVSTTDLLVVPAETQPGQ